ncbi:MAG: glycogen/starch synthase [Bacteroidales bacterium]|nr:glycogen/starch synthase [Bacteroidales bacterium]
MGKGRILFINQAITPFSPENEASLLGRNLPSYVQDSGRDIRVFMPRFSSINDRRHQLHEVIRLSGMNLIVNNCDHQLIIKVGSIPQARLQVYFIDNEEYFSSQGECVDAKGRVGGNIDERLLFYGRGSLEAVRKLAWQPHVIHYTGWFCSMVPFYLRRINKETAFFSGTRTVLSLVGDGFSGVIDNNIERKMKADGATAKDLRLYQNLDYLNLMKATITYAHGIVIASPNVHPELVQFVKENKRYYVDYNPDQNAMFAKVNKLYETLVGANTLNNT